MDSFVEKTKKGKQIVKRLGKRNLAEKKGKNLVRSFYRRNETLFQKAHELKASTGAEVELKVTSPDGVVYQLTDSKLPTAQDVPASPKPGCSYEGDDTPFSPKKTSEQGVQTIQSMDMGAGDIEKCRVCGEMDIPFKEVSHKKALWIGCQHPKCDYWVHAVCLGIMCKTQGPLSKLNYKCPRHIVN